MGITRFQLPTKSTEATNAFFKQIYAAARQVGWGHTTTYGTLAKEVGVGPEVARDVGQAMAKNPLTAGATLGSAGRVEQAHGD